MPTDLPSIPPRAAATHKGEFGHVVVVAGSVGMTGAAVLTTQGALRSGSGLVTLACPARTWVVAASHIREAMVRPVGPDDAGGWTTEAGTDVERFVGSLAPARVVVALGPGFGREPAARRCANFIVTSVSVPLVLDADGLVAFEDAAAEIAHRSSPTVLTPHPGEARRLIGEFDARDESARIAAARRLAIVAGSVVVLKGHRSVVTDGTRTEVNTTGNPGMARGGMGDVLTGVVAGLLAIGLEPFDAARLGVHVHGLAGDAAARDLGEIAMTAGDVVDRLPRAFMSLKAGTPRP